MSLLNAGLKLAISTLNLFDIYKALVSASATRIAFVDLGRSQSVVHRVIRDGVGTPVKSVHVKYRLGSAYRREQLKAALSLVIVWTLFQSLEPTADFIASFLIPFYGSLKTCFLLWIFFARASASTRLMQSFIQPLLQPYEATIDTLFALSLSFFFNLFFLTSLPFAHFMLWMRKTPFRGLFSTRWPLPWTAHHHPSPPKLERMGKSPPTGIEAKRVPPPKAKLHNQRSIERAVPSEKPITGSAPAKHRGQPGFDPRPTTGPRAPRMPARGLPSDHPRSKASTSRIVSGPTHVSDAQRTASVSSTSIPRSKTMSFAVSASQSSQASTPSAPIQMLEELPAAPQGFSRGVDGGYAFIPPATPPTHNQDLKPPFAPTQHFSPIFPGSFAPLYGFPTIPLRMPEDAKRTSSPAEAPTPTSMKKIRSSTANSIKAKAVNGKPNSAVQRAARIREKAQRSASPVAREQLDGRNDLFLGGVEGESDGEAEQVPSVETAVESPAPKRKVLRSSTSMVFPSSRSKRAKIEVLPDGEAGRDEEGLDRTRRTRGESIGASGTRSRATSLEPAKAQTTSSNDNEIRLPLRTSVSTKTLRRPPSRVTVNQAEDMEEVKKSSSKPPVSGLRRGGKPVAASRGGNSRRGRGK